jgi:hypothetical protein
MLFRLAEGRQSSIASALRRLQYRCNQRLLDHGALQTRLVLA